MVQNNVFVRQQQKVSTLAILAALGSFATGAMLPWNLRITSPLPAVDAIEIAPDVSTPSSTPTQAPQQPQSEDDNPTSSTESKESQTAQTPQNRAQTSIALTPASITDGTGVNIEAAINQRIEKMQTKLVKLEKKRFHYPVPQQFQGKKVEKVKLKNNQRVIALTFDDGPWPETTEQILEILEEYEIQATFFWVGAALKQHPEIAEKVAAAGHEIANHTWNHNYDKVSPEVAADEINQTDELIEELTGIKTHLFRPPGGVQDNGLVDYIYTQNYVNVMWSSDSFDWYDSAPQIVDNVMETVTPGGIVLMHDGGGTRYATVEALPEIIDQLKEQGYRFVTVNELLHLAEDNQSKEDLEVQPETEL
ncbi:MAG: polysaccharide deacetylase family protein [Microcoleaceae cyanobacterium]